MLYTFENPVFWHFAVTALLCVLKVMGQGWMTVHAMMSERAGWAAPEDLKQPRLNPDPDPSQMEPNPRVDRARRMHWNDLENIPAFWAAGALFVAVDPPLWAAVLFYWGFVLARAGHFWAYATAQIHDIRATFYSVGSIIVMAMAIWALIALVSGR